MAADCVDRACDLAYQISIALDVPGDKVAIYSTNRFRVLPSPSLRDCIVHPLKAPELDTIRTRLLAVQKSASKSCDGTYRLPRDLKDVIHSITTDFLNSAPESGPRCPYHIFILSPKSLGDLQQGDYQATALYHHVSPWNDVLRPGGKRMSSEDIDIGLHHHASGLNHIHPWTDLHTLMQFARSHNAVGQLRNMTVQIESRSGCQIETRIGPMEAVLLESGQVLSILLQVRVPKVESTKNLGDERFAKGDVRANTFATSDYLIVDLEEFLGDTSTELFTVKVRYEHSLFPANSKICIRETCKLRRSLAGSQWSLPPTSRNAITREGDEPIILPKQNHTRKRQKVRTPERDAPQFCYSEHRPKLCSTESIRLSSESPIDSQIQHSPDKARKIWQHMRKESSSWRGRNRSSGESLEALAMNDHEMYRIKNTAVRNKRSLGASTLRSLRQDIQMAEGQ